MKSIIVHSDKAEKLANQIIKKGFIAEISRSPKDIKERFETNKALIFIGSLGICVREIAPLLNNKKQDPSVINIDANGQFVQAVVSGHIGRANELANELSLLIGATPVITTVSDTSGLWALDLLPEQFNWEIEYSGSPTTLIAQFVNGKKTALLLECRDKGTLHLETSKPEYVDIYYDNQTLNPNNYELIIAVSPFIYDFGINTIYYRPKVLHLGLGCQKGINFNSFEEQLNKFFINNRLSIKSLSALSTITLKKNEYAFLELSNSLNIPLNCYSDEILSAYKVPNPSEKVKTVSGSYGVAEAAAMHSSGNHLYIEKTKLKANNLFFTVAVAFDRYAIRTGFVEFVGAGPGDPELISVRGKKLLQTADYILYAGSLVPKELTYYAKPGCVVESSATMDLETQLNSMKAYYDRGLFIVRLHTGDPCIYGAIQEQMAIMDKWNWKYNITPGISSFQAAAAALKSQFTIPKEVQTIILTRGEGRTPMPEKEQLNKLAKSQSTMCIYLSASIAGNVQNELLKHYPPETPVAICYKLTWKDERIFRCTLETLENTVTANNLSMTTLIVVGKAIDNRQGISKLYDKGFGHAYRNTK
ncbi:MAG: precorrin-4 C(11)-methyltransferase [Marinilabiliaceae bacterium]|nr:precorrin-4 C(11)-methyltransferase [Marinilabiliaceae bacterium]